MVRISKYLDPVLNVVDIPAQLIGDLLRNGRRRHEPDRTDREDLRVHRTLSKWIPVVMDVRMVLTMAPVRCRFRLRRRGDNDHGRSLGLGLTRSLTKLENYIRRRSKIVFRILSGGSRNVMLMHDGR